MGETNLYIYPPDTDHGDQVYSTHKLHLLSLSQTSQYNHSQHDMDGTMLNTVQNDISNTVNLLINLYCNRLTADWLPTV